METTTPVFWSSDDESKLATFLASKTGQRLIPKMLEAEPALLANGDTNTLIVRLGEVRGWHAAIQRMIDISHAEPVMVQPETRNYPDLLDNKAWPETESVV